jgi:hypothetical protein
MAAKRLRSNQHGRSKQSTRDGAVPGPSPRWIMAWILIGVFGGALIAPDNTPADEPEQMAHIPADEAPAAQAVRDTLD